MAEKFISNYTAEEIEQILESSDICPFVLYYDKANQVYRFFKNKERRDIWVAAYESGNMTPEISSYLFTLDFTAPAPYSINISGLKDNQYILLGSKGNKLEYSFQTVDGNGSQVNESVDAYYTFKSPAGTISTSSIYNAGTNVSLNIDDYLSIGTNVITILLRGRSTGTTKTVVVTYYVVQLDLTSTFDIARSIQPNTNFGVTYTITGQGDKTIEFYIDGQIVVTASVSSLESSATRTQVISNSSGTYAPGRHYLQIRANMMAGDQQFYSKILYYEFIITGKEQTETLIEETFPPTANILVGARPGLSGEQYVTYTLNWAYYSSNPLMQSATIQWRLYTESGQETTLATRVTDVVEAETDKKPEPLQFQPTETGDYLLQALINGIVIGEYTISVIANTSGLIETTEGLTMKLSGLGRSNDEPSDILDSWADRGYTTQFYNQPWNDISGWVNNNALQLNNGATAVINNKPLAQELYSVTRNGGAIELDFETFNVDYDDAVLLSIEDTRTNSDGKRINEAKLIVTGNEVSLYGSISAKITAKFKSDERVKVTFVIYPKATSDYPQKIFIYCNGVLSGVANYDENENFDVGKLSETLSTEGMIKIGNSEGKGAIRVYYIRTYSNAISTYQQLYNYFIDSGENLTRLVMQNDIYVSGSRNIDVDKIEGRITTIKITGPLDALINKGGKNTISAGLEIVSPDNPNINMHCSNAQFSNAGQSTLDKAIPSLHVKLDKNNNICYDRDNKPLIKNKWTFRNGNIPEKKWRAAANYMDSSGCHGASFLRMFSEVAPKVQINNEYVLRMPCENYVADQYSNAMRAAHGEDPSGNNWRFPYTFHMTPDSIPAVLVWRPDESSAYRFLGQYVIMEEKKANFSNGMHSIYDSIDENGNPDPFQYSTKEGNRLYDNSGTYQFEILTSTDDISLFLDDSKWDEDRLKQFEKVYPDEDDQTSEEISHDWNLFYNTFVHPIIQTKGNQAAFDALYGTVLNRWHFAAYYCLGLRNCCSDSFARNMELITFDGGSSWLPKWWDVDNLIVVYKGNFINYKWAKTVEGEIPNTVLTKRITYRSFSSVTHRR